MRLLECALEADQQLWILLIMRSEFLTSFLATAHARLFRDPVTVGALSRTALFEVIAGPAAQAGLRFDPPELVQLMVDEAGGGEALPLLAFTLQELYLDAGRSRVVTGADYRRMHGVTGALRRQADRVTAELRAADPDSPVMATLLRFVAFTDGAAARRRVRAEPPLILPSAGSRTRSCPPACCVASSRADGEAVLDVAHEALFRHWAPLRQEIEAHTEELQRRADLERWAADWERSGRQDSYLLRADRLRAVSQFAAHPARIPDRSWSLSSSTARSAQTSSPGSGYLRRSPSGPWPRSTRTLSTACCWRWPRWRNAHRPRPHSTPWLPRSRRRGSAECCAGMSMPSPPSTGHPRGAASRRLGRRHDPDLGSAHTGTTATHPRSR